MVLNDQRRAFSDEYVNLELITSHFYIEVSAGHPITRKYCAFWKKDNSGFYIEEFVELLKRHFSCME